MGSAAATLVPSYKTDDQTLSRLQTATLFNNYDAGFRKSAYSSIGWGVFSAVIGAVLLSRGSFGWINLAFGIFLIGEGVYEMRVRDPKVVKVTAFTLGTLAAWNLGSFAYSAYFQVGLGGHPLYGFMQALGAYNTYKTYAHYKELFEKADAATVEQVKLAVAEMKADDPASSPDMVEFEAKPKDGESAYWRVRFIKDLAFFVMIGGLFGRKSKVKEAFWAYKRDIQLENLGDKFMSKKLKFKVQVNQIVIDKASISQEMLAKFESLNI
jgi:hypothetical protein